jgi:hypothetical protein
MAELHGHPELGARVLDGEIRSEPFPRYSKMPASRCAPAYRGLRGHRHRGSRKSNDDVRLGAGTLVLRPELNWDELRGQAFRPRGRAKTVTLNPHGFHIAGPPTVHVRR